MSDSARRVTFIRRKKLAIRGWEWTSSIWTLAITSFFTSTCKKNFFKLPPTKKWNQHSHLLISYTMWPKVSFVNMIWLVDSVLTYQPFWVIHIYQPLRSSRIWQLNKETKLNLNWPTRLCFQNYLKKKKKKKITYSVLAGVCVCVCARAYIYIYIYIYIFIFWHYFFINTYLIEHNPIYPTPPLRQDMTHGQFLSRM